MNRAIISWSARGLCFGLVAVFAGCNLVTVPDGNDNGNGNGNDNGSPGNPVPGSCVDAAAAGLPAPTAQLLFPTADAEIDAGEVTFLWISGDAGGDSLEVTFYLGGQPDVFDNPAETRTICVRPNAELDTTTANLTAGSYFWGIEVTDGVTTVRRPADGVGVAFEVVTRQGGRSDLPDAILLCPRDNELAREVTTFTWSLGEIVPLHTQVFVSRVGDPNPFDNTLRVFDVAPPTQTTLALDTASALPLGELLSWGLRIETADGVRFTFGGESGATFTPAANVPPSGALLGPANETRLADGVQSFPLSWNADAGNCEDALTGTVFLEFLGDAAEPQGLFDSPRRIEVGPGALEVNLVGELSDADLDAGRWAWGVRAGDGTDTTDLADGGDPARTFRTFIRDRGPRFVNEPIVDARTCTGGSARDALVFDYADDNGDATVAVTLFYAPAAGDVFSAPAASEALAPRASGADVVIFLQTTAGGCEAFVHGAGFYGVELSDGVNPAVRQVVEYVPATGACCLASGACLETLEDECPGTFQGLGTTCATAFCPAPPIQDCNTNGVPDAVDIASGASTDCNANGIPDECDGPLPTRYYVDADATGTNDGSSWANAFVELRDALSAASNVPVDEIWVAEGEYRPAPGGGSAFSSFDLLDGTAVYGGFAGNEICLAQRDPAVNVTILSGDLDGDDNNIIVGTNSIHVVTSSQNDASAILDGFTIRAGNASGGLAPNDGRGAGIFISGADPTIVGCRFVGNDAVSQGGAAFITEGSPTFTACTFIDNSAGAVGAAGGSGGGAVANEGGTPRFEACEFRGNVAIGDGGAVRNLTGDIVFVNSTFALNSAIGSGGGLATDDSVATLTGCDFDSNGASSNGGAIRVQSATVNLTGCSLTRNFASSSGGALYNAGGTANVTASTFADNRAEDGDGGAMSGTSAGSDVRDSVFSRNLARFGNGGAIGDLAGSLTLSGTTFEQNVAIAIEGGDGGAVYASTPLGPTVTGCTFTQNLAFDDGGGLYFSGLGLVVRDTEFRENVALNDGGGLALVGGLNVSVANALFAGNNVGTNGFDQGGAIAVLGSTLQDLADSTIANNGAGQTGGVFVAGNSTMVAANCIFWGNVDEGASTQDAQVFVDPDAQASVVSYSIIEGLDPGGELDTPPNVNNLDDDPLFVGASDFRLSAGSPAIDAGNNDAVPADVTTDLDGNARFIDDPATIDTGDPPGGAPFVDFGAYEFVP